MTFVPLVAVVVLFWAGVLFVMFTAQGSSVADFFKGPKAPLPEDLGQWKDVGSVEPGRVRQERRLTPGNKADPDFLILQVRFVDRNSGEIVVVLPEQREPRRRSRPYFFRP